MNTPLQHHPPVRANRWRRAIWGAAACLLLLPAVAMQLTREVAWDAADFVVMGLMLGAACGAYEVGARMSGSTAYRAGFALAIATGFLIVWVNLAVGIIGGAANPANLTFAGVLLLGGAVALVGRLRPAAMVRAMSTAAAAQLAVAAYAALFAHSLEGTIASLVFTGAWLSAAGLFNRARGRPDDARA